jgi:hypothetical protein
MPVDLYDVLSSQEFTEHEEPPDFDFMRLSSHRATRLIYAYFDGPGDRNRIMYSIERDLKDARKALTRARSAYANNTALEDIAVMNPVGLGAPAFCVSSRLYGVECWTVERSVIVRGDSYRRTEDRVVGSLTHASTLLSGSRAPSTGYELMIQPIARTITS